MPWGSLRQVLSDHLPNTAQHNTGYMQYPSTFKQTKLGHLWRASLSGTAPVMDESCFSWPPCAVLDIHPVTNVPIQINTWYIHTTVGYGLIRHTLPSPTHIYHHKSYNNATLNAHQLNSFEAAQLLMQSLWNGIPPSAPCHLIQYNILYISTRSISNS